MRARLQKVFDLGKYFTKRWYSILLISVGLSGFLFTDLVMFNRSNLLTFRFSNNTIPSFQELRVNKDSIYLDLLGEAIVQAKKDTSVAESEKIRLVDSLKYLGILYQSRSKQARDSVFNNAVIWINKLNKEKIIDNKIDLSDTLRETVWTEDSAVFALKPPTQKSKMIYINKKFILKTADSNVAFVTKYPAFGVWVILIFIMSIACSMVGIIVTSSLFMLKKRVAGLGLSLQPWRARKTFLLFLLGLAGFFWVASNSFYDALSFNGTLFINNYRCIYITICCIGYLAAAFCFAAFLVCAHYMFIILEDDISLVPNAYPEANDPTDPDNKEKREKALLYTKKLLLLKSYFNLYLLIIALLFGLMVMATGTLFTAFNGLDFIKLVQLNEGTPYLTFDGVFLYAGMHSFLLLLFFVPVRITMMQVEAMYNENQSIINSLGAGTNNWKAFVSGLINLLKDLLIPASPLIAGMLQKLIESFLK